MVERTDTLVAVALSVLWCNTAVHVNVRRGGTKTL